MAPAPRTGRSGRQVALTVLVGHLAMEFATARADSSLPVPGRSAPAWTVRASTWLPNLRVRARSAPTTGTAAVSPVPAAFRLRRVRGGAGPVGNPTAAAPDAARRRAARVRG